MRNAILKCETFFQDSPSLELIGELELDDNYLRIQGYEFDTRAKMGIDPDGEHFFYKSLTIEQP